MDDPRQSPKKNLVKIQAGPGDISLIGHLHFGSFKAQIMEKHSYGDILEPHSTFLWLISANLNRKCAFSHSRQPRKSCYMLPVDVATK
jgi:hypothetical protein